MVSRQPLRTQPSGQPTLFVPGNAGSYQQVRSIASSAARQFYSQPGERAADMAGSRPRDFFAGESGQRRYVLC